MFAWLSCTAIFASSTSIWMNSSSSAKLGWIILRATYFSNPATPVVFARWISAMPPTAIWRTRRYGPNCRSATAGELLVGRPRAGDRLAARVHEHADQAQRSLRAAIERAHDLGRDPVRDVDDVARGRVRDEVEAQARAVGLAIDLVGLGEALVDVLEDRVLREPAEPIADRDREHLVGRGVADRHGPRRARPRALVRIDLGKDLLAVVVDRRVVERVHQQLLAHLAD